MAEPDDQERDQRRHEVAQLALARAEALKKLERATAAILAELKTISDELAVRPTRLETNLRRRSSAMLLVLGMLVGLFTLDTHVELCAPGSRVEGVVNEFFDQVERNQRERTQEPLDLDRIQEVAAQPRPAFCDISVPIHTHGLRHEWPTKNNVLGMLLYGGVILLAFTWARWPALSYGWLRARRRRKHPEWDQGADERANGNGDST